MSIKHELCEKDCDKIDNEEKLNYKYTQNFSRFNNYSSFPDIRFYDPPYDTHYNNNNSDNENENSDNENENSDNENENENSDNENENENSDNENENSDNEYNLWDQSNDSNQKYTFTSFFDSPGLCNSFFYRNVTLFDSDTENSSKYSNDDNDKEEDESDNEEIPKIEQQFEIEDYRYTDRIELIIIKI